MDRQGDSSFFSVKNAALFFSAIVCILLVAIFLILHLLQHKTFREQEHLTTALRDDINRHLKTSYSSTCEALARQPAIINLFSGTERGANHRATVLLNSSREILGANIIYVLDRQGTVIASSFTENGGTLYGNNYRFRPYFTKAINGESYTYGALGVTTNKRGIYFSSAINGDTQQNVGVAVIKSGLEKIDKILLKTASRGPVAILSEHGVVFAASEDSWLFHTAKPLDPKTRQELIDSRQFAEQPLPPLPVNLARDEAEIGGKSYTVHRQKISLQGWSVITLLPKQSPFPTIVIVALLFSVPVYFFLLKVKHFQDEISYKDKINRQNIHLKHLNEEMKNEIEERKETEEALMRVSEHELQYRILFEQSRDAITIVSETGRFLEANQAFLAMMECSREEITTMKPVDFWLNETERRNWLKKIKEQGSLTDYHSKQKTKTGKILDLSLSTNATITRDGNTVYLSILRDITQKLADEQKLVAAKNEAEQANRAKSNFLANMSHEIRTPMNGIIGMTNIVLESKLTKEQRNYLTMVSSSADRLLDIINNILDFSKIEAGRLELEKVSFNIREKCAELLSLLSVKAREKGVELATEIDRNVPPLLLGDPTRLMQILINLTNNAIKFSDNGSVTIQIHRQQLLPDEKVLIHCSVKDDGIGIPTEKQAAIFGSFAQADLSTTRKYGGTGLGLTISSQLCRLMGGGIGLESEEGKGATFWFTIPFGIPQVAESKPESDREIRVNRVLPWAERFKNINILLAEDDHINQILALAVLEKAGIKVTSVNNGLEAVRQSAERHYDLILMDIQMPEMDGYEATRTIRRQEQNLSQRTPVVAMTAHAIKGDREKCLQAGMDDYITKPISATTLYNVIEKNLQCKVLVADNAAQHLEEAGGAFTKAGWLVTLAENGQQCYWECQNSTFDLVIVNASLTNLDLVEFSIFLQNRAEETGRHTRLFAVAESFDKKRQRSWSAAGIEEINPRPLSWEVFIQSFDLTARKSNNQNIS